MESVIIESMKTSNKEQLLLVLENEIHFEPEPEIFQVFGERQNVVSRLRYVMRKDPSSLNRCYRGSVSRESRDERREMGEMVVSV